MSVFSLNTSLSNLLAEDTFDAVWGLWIIFDIIHKLIIAVTEGCILICFELFRIDPHLQVGSKAHRYVGGDFIDCALECRAFLYSVIITLLRA